MFAVDDLGTKTLVVEFFVFTKIVDKDRMISGDDKVVDETVRGRFRHFVHTLIKIMWVVDHDIFADEIDFTIAVFESFDEVSLTKEFDIDVFVGEMFVKDENFGALVETEDGIVAFGTGSDDDGVNIDIS